MIFLSAAKPPTFSVFGPFYLFEESEGRLKCEPDAAPKPTFKWYFTPKGGDESQITIGQAGYRILSDGTLVIDKVTKQDAGQYRCWASNSIGTDQATAEATILRKNMIRLINTLRFVGSICQAQQLGK